MKTKVLSIILLGASLGLGSCSDYLDMTPTDRASDKLVWSKLDYAEQAVNDFYRYIDYLGAYRDGQCLAGMTEALTDQLKYGSYNYMAKCQIPSEIAYGGSVLTVNYVSTYLGNWGTMYEYVRRVNEGINKLKKYASFGQADEERLEAEMRFFRGYLYTDLLKRYKEVIIYDENLDNIKKDMPVSSEADGWNFVYNDLKYAGEHLPVDKTPNGRLTSGAAYAMLSRAMLYAERWDDARIAAEKVMGMGYELEAKEDYSNAFKAGSKEAILQYCYDKSSTVTHDFDGYMVPGGDKALDGNSMTGGFGTPTQEMVESYEYADGSGFPDWSAWHTAEGTTTTPPYDKLEPRFKATILYNGATWKGRTLQLYVDGNDGYMDFATTGQDNVHKSTTGYLIRKFASDDTNINFSSILSGQYWIEMRLAEIYLIRSEAYARQNEFGKAYADLKTIRDRVGLPELAQQNNWSDYLEDLSKERICELGMEGHRYFDLIRWGIAVRTLDHKRLHGVKITQAGGSFSYARVECDTQDRLFPEKYTIFPIPYTELQDNTLCEQNELWK